MTILSRLLHGLDRALGNYDEWRCQTRFGRYIRRWFSNQNVFLFGAKENWRIISRVKYDTWFNYATKKKSPPSKDPYYCSWNESDPSFSSRPEWTCVETRIDSFSLLNMELQVLEEVKAGDEYVSMGSLCPAGKITILNRSLFNIESIRLDSTLKKKK